MSGPWLLLALTLILAGVPGSCAQPEEGAQEEAVQNVLSLADRLLQKDLQRVRGDLGGALKSLIPRPNWIYKRQHPGKREKAEKEGQVAVDLEAPKPEDPVRWEEVSLLPDFAEEVKRQHPGRRSPRMKYPAIKRQHPGRRLADPNFQSWEEEEEGEGTWMHDKRQHPGKRVPGGPCGPQEDCGQVDDPFGFLDVSRGQEEAQENHWPKQVAWVREPLEV